MLGLSFVLCLFYIDSMSSARFETTMDFMRHRADMRIVCECGRTINVPFWRHPQTVCWLAAAHR